MFLIKNLILNRNYNSFLQLFILIPKFLTKFLIRKRIVSEDPLLKEFSFPADY